ncbi:MAG: hypothetical protein EXQ70_11420 [Solirubrobacterales bacterium]|nr:hypothetical protein [Solirubrobacterales bacterium]
MVKALRRSPAHRLLDRRLVLISVTGLRSGREFTFPVGYRQDGDRVEIVLGWAKARGDGGNGVVVDVRLDAGDAAA